MSKANPTFFQRLFGGERTVPPSSPLDDRVASLERALKNAVLEWDDAIARMSRLAGRASKLQHLENAGQHEQPVSRADELNRQIMAERTARPPFLNGGHS